MNPRLHVEMLNCLSSLIDDEKTRVVVITGTGDSFCSGMDLKEYFMAQRDKPEKMDQSRRTAKAWMGTLRTFPKATIAAVNGWCFGAGLRVMGLCDIAIASDRAVFGLSEINFGMFPGGGVTKTCSDLLQPRDALYMILTGEPISAKQAYEMRLVNKVIAHEKLRTEVSLLADKLKVHNLLTVRLAKEVFRAVRPLTDETAYDYENSKVEELTYLQKAEWVNVALQKFKKKKFRPGLESYKSTHRRKNRASAI